MIVRVRRITRDEDRPHGARYAVDLSVGRTVEVFKEFYADGPSLFTWKIGGQDGDYPTKRAALSALAGPPPRLASASGPR